VIFFHNIFPGIHRIPGNYCIFSSAYTGEGSGFHEPVNSYFARYLPDRNATSVPNLKTKKNPSNLLKIIIIFEKKGS
jgi:hypothetical protein